MFDAACTPPFSRSTAVPAMSKSDFWRSITRCALAVVRIIGFVSIQAVGHEQEYSKGWMINMLNSGESGSCSPLSRTYEWRNVGWGSNLHGLFATWLDGIVRDGETNDFSVDVSPPHFQKTKCPGASERTGEELAGWRCFFQPMARLCLFETEEELGKFLATNFQETHRTLKRPPRSPRASLHDEVETIAAMLGYVYSKTQPWFREDTDSVLREDTVAAVRSERYVAIHVRRGDKITHGEAKRTEVSVYLQAAESFLGYSTEGDVGPSSITGLWVSSDDSSVLQEAKALASDYFPNVQPERVVSISFRTEAPSLHSDRVKLPSTSHFMTYELYVGLHAELFMMSHAEIFVGTFSSNVGRLVYLMREVNGLSRNSTISVDSPWNF